MTSSLKRRTLSKPEQGTKIHPFDLGLVRGRNKNKAHSMLLELFQESSLSKADLAKMLGKKPEQITRWLGGPGNLTLDTLSDLIFAMTGQFFTAECIDELSRGKSNRQSPEWLHHSTKPHSWNSVLVTPEVNRKPRQATPPVTYSLNLSSKDSKKETRNVEHGPITEQAVHSVI